MTLNTKQRERRKAWAKALRSGSFKQGKGFLSRGDEYCCLGVACALFANSDAGLEAGAHFMPQGGGTKPALFYDKQDGLGALSRPPVDVNDYFGLDLTEIDNLIRLNDDWGTPFSEIAGLVESEDPTKASADLLRKHRAAMSKEAEESVESWDETDPDKDATE